MKKTLLKSIYSILGVLVFAACVQDEGGEIPVYLEVDTEVSSIDFEAVTVGQSATESYRVYATELTGALSITATSPFTIAKEVNGSYSESLSLTAADFDKNFASIYVQYAPEVVENVEGDITHSTEGLVSSPMVSLTALGVLDPSQLPNILLTENFDYSDAVLPFENRLTSDGNQNLEGWLKVRAANKDLELAEASLSFEGYPDSGIGKSVIVDRNPDVPGANANLFQQNLSEQQTSEFVGSYYCSFLMQVEDFPANVGGYNSPVKYASWNTTNGASLWASGVLVQNRKAAVDDPDDVVFGLRYEATLLNSEKAVETGKTYLIVLKHEVTEAIPAEGEATATSEASLYVFEEGDEIDMESETATPVIVMENVPDKTFIRAVTLFQENDPNGRYIVDGLRVTNDWEDLFK